MFEQHPVPQQISSYQFKLVGDMTLKQFFQLAGGAIVALIIYALPLPNIIKWPLVAISVLSGAAFAFLPIQDRPLEQWLVAFLRSIYSYTIFVWNPPAQQPQYYQTEGAASPPQPQPQPQPQSPHEPFINNLDKTEENFLQKVSGMLHQQQSVGQETPQQTPMPQPTEPEKQVVDEPQQSKQAEVSVPDARTVALEKKGFEKLQQSNQIKTSEVGEALVETPHPASAQPQFSQEAAPPTPPTSPNILVGQVMDQGGKIVENAILEVKDQQGRPVRALKSNKAGHFQIVTPLPDGRYQIIIEKDPLSFNPIEITAQGEIIQPLAVRAITNLTE